MNEENGIKIMEFNQEEQSIEILGNKINKSYESWEAFLEEMKRLTLIQNNWNELKKYLQERTMMSVFDRQVTTNVLNKMQELEGNNE